MPISPFRKNLSRSSDEVKKKLLERTGINNFERDSKTKTIIDPITNELNELKSEVDFVFRQNNLTTATGGNVDSIGEDHGVSRLQPTFAFVSEEESNLAFFVEDGTFGDINSGNAILVPAGTLISTIENSNENNAVIYFRTLEDITLLPGQSLVYIGAEATTAGMLGNVGRGSLRRHNFVDYTNANANSLRVLNFYSILNGRNAESDSNYKFRISNKYVGIAQNNRTKILLDSIVVPGVLDLKFIDGYHGIGTLGVVVLGSDGQASPLMLERVRENINSINRSGSSIFVFPAIETAFSFEMEIKPNSTITDSERFSIEKSIKKIIMNELRSVPIGGNVSFQSTSAAISLELSESVSFVSEGKTHFKNAYVSEYFSFSESSLQIKLISDSYQLKEDSYAYLNDVKFSWV